MCGILGLLTTNPTPDLDTRMRAGLKALRHRGPDDRGLEMEQVAGKTLALGHTRLSIIDLSPGGRQPMHTPDGRYTIVYNGEIYNYRELRRELKGLGHDFRTDSDTEVLLAAWAQWGVDGLRRLVGMFAFVVLDRVVQTLTLVRDAFGIKPLFYRPGGDSLAFASEIPALLKLLPDKPRLNVHRAYQYLVFGGYDNGPDTFYQDILHLQPDHWLQIQLDESTVGAPQRWWWPSIEERTDLSFADAAAQLREMFLNNVRLHLRSDVPLGAALSGGIDSSAVVCAMRHLEPDMPIHTFSYVARGSGVDEEQWADLVNSHVDAIPHKVVVSPDELAGDLDDMILAHGEPFGGTSIYAQYRVFKAAREAGIVVTLDGQGADELLAGYSGYPDSFLLSLLDHQRYLRIPGFLHAWSKWPGRGRKQAMLMLGSALTPQRLRKLARQAIGHDPSPPWLCRDWLRNHGVEMNFPEPLPLAPEASGRRLVERLRFALTKGLAPLLRHGDRDSMRWTIESRVPFLTTDLAEFLLNMPESYLLSPKGETKHIFRAAMRGIIPDAILDRRDKIGFQTPEQDWLCGQEVQIHEWLSTADKLPFLSASATHEAVENILRGNIHFSFQAWRLINYCRWAQLQ